MVLISINKDKLEKINSQLENIDKELSFFKEKLVVIESFEEKINAIDESFSLLLESFAEEANPEELEKQMKEQAEGMKNLVKAAIVEVLNEAQGEQQTNQALGGIDIEKIKNQDGNIDPLAALIMFLNGKGGGNNKPSVRSYATSGKKIRI